MERDKLELKDEYSKEEVLDIVRETVFRISREMDDELFDLKDKISKENDSLIEAGLKRRKYQLEDDRSIVDKYYSTTTQKWLSGCCGAKLRYFALADHKCSECGEKDPDTYSVELGLEDFINFVNKKMDEEDQK